MKKIVFGFIAASVIASFSIAAEPAPPAKSAKQAKNVVQFRQALLQLVRSNVGVLGGMAKGAVPMNADTIALKGMRLEQLSLMMEDYFKMDTRGFDVGTDSLDKIWENQSDFKTKIDALTLASVNLQSVAKSADESQFKPAIGAIFKSCKGCHDDYKAE
jgi:cytochrome c556